MLLTRPSVESAPPTGRSSPSARRELGALVGTAFALLAIALLLDRSRLALQGPMDQLSSWTEGSPGVVAVRVLRVVLQTGSAALLLWLAMLSALCIPKRTARLSTVSRLPLGVLVRRALVGTVTVAIVASSGVNAHASSRPAVIANDATGGQRWPDLASRTTAPAAGQVAAATTASPTTIAPTLASLVPRTTGESLSSPTRSPTSAPGAAGPYFVRATEPFIEHRLVAGPATSAIPDAADGTVHGATGVHVVRPGESFWSIAEDEVLTNVDEATDADVAAYWKVFIELNRDGLPDPENPDLLWVDSVLRLPIQADANRPAGRIEQ